MATVEAQGLRKTFGKSVALDGVDFRIEEGRIVGLIGPRPPRPKPFSVSRRTKVSCKCSVAIRTPSVIV